MSPVAIGAGILFLVAIVVVVLSSSQGKDQKGRALNELQGESAFDAVASETGSRGVDLVPTLTRLLERLQLSRKLQWLLLRAGIMLKPSEMAAVSLGMAAAGFLAGAILQQHSELLHGLLPAVVLAATGFAAPWLYVAYRRRKRNTQLNAQLSEALNLISSSLRSGYSFLRAAQVVIDEMDPPISDELRWVLDETSVGIALEEALDRLAYRTESDDVRLIVTAVQIQAIAGGNLAEILENTGNMIRERVRLKQELGAVTAEGRLSAGILSALPPAMGIIVNMMSPGYLAPLFSEPLGLAMLAGGTFMLLLGILTIRQMLQIQI